MTFPIRLCEYIDLYGYVFLAPSFLTQTISFFLFFNKVISFICYYLAVDNYALLFTRKGTSDYVITRGMPNLKGVTFCLWMKSADKGNSGTPLSYAVSAAHNELLLFDYRNLRIVIGGSWRYII